MEWLTDLFNIIFKIDIVPEAWRWGMMVLLYKNKGDMQNYNGIKLLSHTMKVWERWQS